MLQFPRLATTADSRHAHLPGGSERVRKLRAHVGEHMLAVQRMAVFELDLDSTNKRMLTMEAVLEYPPLTKGAARGAALSSFRGGVCCLLFAAWCSVFGVWG